MDPREDKRRAIFERQNRVARVDGENYLMSSQPPDKKYQIIATESGWTSSCPDHIYRCVCCMHICAGEMGHKMLEAVQKSVAIKQVGLGKCKLCDSQNATKESTKSLRRHVPAVQMWRLQEALYPQFWL